MKQFLKVLMFGVFVLFVGCASRSSHDLLADRIEQERVYIAMKNYPDLIKINKEKLQKNDTPENRLKLAQNYYDIGDFDSTLYYIAPLLKEGKNPHALLLEAKVLESQDRLKEALQTTQKLIVIDSKNAQAYNLLGIIKTKEKDFKQAKENFLKAKELFLPDNIVNNNLGMLAILTGEFNEAVNYLLPLYHRNFKESKLVNNLILALVKAGRKEEALEIIKKQRLSRNPDTLIEELGELENVFEKNS